MQSLYELLKASKGLPVSDSYAALWGKSAAESGIKTLTGRLPLFFHTSERKLRDWVIYGNNDVGKNLLEITAESQTINGVTFTVDKQAGTITTSGLTTNSAAVLYAVHLQPGSYIFTCDADANRNRTFDSYVRVPSATLARDNDSDEPGNAFTIDEERTVYIYNRIWAGNRDTPHVFKPMLRRADTSEAFEPYQIGVGERTKNLLEITVESQTIHGVTFTVDKQAGTVTATRESASSSDAILAIEIPDEAKEQNLYFSGCPSEGSASTYNVYVVDYDTTLRALQWNGVTPSVTDYGTSNNEVRFVEGHRSQIRLRIKAGYDAQNVVFKPMLRESDTTADFIPYGYQIPLDVRDDMTGEYIYASDIFIGESPLTEGKSISKSSTGIDIQTIADQGSYPNILTTALTNKPVIMIKYKE